MKDPPPANKIKIRPNPQYWCQASTVQAISEDFLKQYFKNKLYSEAVVIQFFPADRYKANPPTLYQ